MQELEVIVVEQDSNIANKIMTFLKSIDTIASVEENLITNGVALQQEEDIVGFITYEEYAEYGLIRYFIFQKQIALGKVIEMFDSLCDVARLGELAGLISIGKNQEVIDLFESLGFNKIDKENFLVGGKTVYGTDLENATILLHKL